jgi:hypothetical protein
MASGVSTNTSIKRPPQALAHHLPFRAVRRYKCRQYHQPGIDHQPGHFTDAANVLFAILIAESQVAAQAMTHVIAVQQIGADAALMQASSSAPATVDLPDPERPVNHSTTPRWP